MSGLTRRALLQGMVAAAAASQIPLFVRPGRAGAAFGPGGSPLLVMIFLRGGADGLALLPPLGDGALEQARGPLIARPTLSLEGRGGGFGLHPGLGPLAPLVHDGRFAAVHAVGLPEAIRSHFEAQDACERAGARAGSRTEGWLSRAIAAAPGEPAAFRAVAAATQRPRSLAGDPRALAFEHIEDLVIPARSPAAQRALAELHAERPPSDPGARLAAAGREALEAVRALEAHRSASLPEADSFPRSPLGQRFATIARLARADLGLVAASADAEGWDTHVGQGAEEGRFARAAQDLGASLAALFQSLESRAGDLLVVAVSEFGRTVAVNGSGGTDHGRGGAALLLGAPVRGGRVAGGWPGTGPNEREDGR
ncbi:MAG TPA: transcriptional initiation protein Tat, partial [Deltaproteobacteria bacterium]|nr:transcriptional initiation protein Tat [Deltaproteobacteria bacterium]